MCKRKKTIEVIEVECSSWDCDGFYMYTGSLPDTCPEGHMLLHNTARRRTISYKDKDNFDIEKGGCYSPRPSWYSGRQQEIMDRDRSPGRTIYCQICGQEIEVNADGKEEWYSKSGKLHKTLPHIDHYYSPGRDIGGDWIERKRELYSDPSFLNKSKEEQKRIKREVFNASPLRTAHMMCNCSRPKQ